MKSRIVPVKNIARLSKASKALLNRATGAPGIGLVDGLAGYGKSLGTTWLSVQTPSIYVRALALWTPSGMLGAMCKELRQPVGGSCGAMVERIAEVLLRTKQTVFIDEADYLTRRTSLIETLRDLHDLTTVPVILIGETGIEQKLAHLTRFTSRIAEHVTFEPLDIDDTALLAKEMCEVRIQPDLLSKIHSDTKGNTRNIVVSLSRAEQIALANGSDTICAADVGRRALFTGAGGVSVPMAKAA